MNQKGTEKRLVVLFLIVIVSVLIIVGRLWYLQLARGEHYARLADGNRMRQLRLLPARGEIRDRNGHVLVRSKSAFTISVVPSGIPREDSTVMELLGALLNLTAEELNEAIEKGRGAPYEPVRVQRDADPETVIAIEENRINLPGIFIEEEPVREHLSGTLAAHVVGYLGAISTEELQQYGTSYRGSDLVGKSGIEKTYEELLRGEIGALTVEVNALSRPIQTVNVLEPVPGHNLTLTLDANLQQVAENAFLEHIQTLDEKPGTQTGAVLAMNPQTGEILVMASIPGYDPEILNDQAQRNTYYNSLIIDQRLPFFNRAIQALYGPGSTFKPITALAILEAEVISAKDRFNATGTSQYGVKDWVINSGLAPFGMINMNDALGMSSNHYFADNGSKVGIDRLSEWMEKLGFGAPTGLELFPGEATGLLPSREWKRYAFRESAISEQNWYPSDTEQISIGQGFHQMTLIQLAQAYAAIANKGQIFKPQLIKEIEAPDGTIIYELRPELARQVEAKTSTWDELLEALQAPITHPRGTARNVMQGFPYPMAGKTGTWEVVGSISNGLFVGFAPVDNPEILVAVVVERGGGGASTATPIARKVFDAYFGLNEVAED